MFILLGLLIDLIGLAQALIAFIVALLGNIRGRLSYALLAGMYLVSGISGSKAADMAAIAPSLFPGMKRRGAHPGELVAELAASGTMSETIPPSLVLITIGSSARVSIAGLFTGGLLPAAVGALALIVIVRLRSKRGDRLSERPSGRSFLVALPALALLPEWMVAGDVEAGRLERCLPALRAFPAGYQAEIYAVHARQEFGPAKIATFVMHMEGYMAARPAG